MENCHMLMIVLHYLWLHSVVLGSNKCTHAIQEQHYACSFYLEENTNHNILQNTKAFSKCYLGRNGKRDQQKVQVCGSLKTQSNQGCQD